MATAIESLVDRAASVYLPYGLTAAEKETLALRVTQGHSTSVDVLNSIAMSGGRNAGDVDELARLFFLVFDRPPDLPTFQAGVSLLGQGFTLREICQYVMNLGTSTFSSRQTNEEFVNTLARQMTADPSTVPGLFLVKQVLTDELNAGILSRESLLEAVTRISSASIKYETLIEISLAMLVGAGREATKEDFHDLQGQSGIQLMRSALKLGNEAPYASKPYFSITANSMVVSNELSEAFTFNLQSSEITNATDTSFGIVLTRDGGLSESPTYYKEGVISGVTNIDLSLVGGAGNNHVIFANNVGSTIHGPNVASALYGGDANDIIVGGKDADIISGGRGNDQLTGGEGGDTIDGGPGQDVISLIEVLSTPDKVILGSIRSSADTIEGFRSGSDILDLSSSLAPGTLTIGTQVTYFDDKDINIASVTTAANVDAAVYYILNTSGGAGEMTLAEIEDAISAGSSATGETVVLIDNGEDTRIYVDSEAQTSSGDGSGLILIGTLFDISGLTALSTGDLISI